MVRSCESAQEKGPTHGAKRHVCRWRVRRVRTLDHTLSKDHGAADCSGQRLAARPDAVGGSVVAGITRYTLQHSNAWSSLRASQCRPPCRVVARRVGLPHRCSVHAAAPPVLAAAAALFSRQSSSMLHRVVLSVDAARLCAVSETASCAVGAWLLCDACLSVLPSSPGASRVLFTVSLLYNTVTAAAVALVFPARSLSMH
jgi:hypothetical protein